MKYFNIKCDFSIYAKLFVVLLAVYSPILISSFNYIDDYGRSLYGYNGLDANGRPVAAIILWATMWFGDVVDISPFPQVISIALISASAILLKDRLESSIGRKIGFLPIIFIFTAPTYLPMILFKYDSVSMAFSIFSAILAFVVMNNTIKSYICAVILLILSMLSYQASISIFIILSCYKCIFLYFDKNEAPVRSLLSSAFVSIVAVILSSLISKQYTTGVYNETHSALLNFSRSSINTMLSNSTKYLDMINMSYPMAWVIYVIYVIYLSYKLLTTDNIFGFIRKVFIFILGILCPLFIFIHLSALADPVFNIRTLIGTSFAISMSVIFFAKNTILRRCVFIALIAYNSIIYAATLNSIRYQMNYDNNISLLVMSDLTSNKFSGVKNIYTEGRVYYPQEVSNINKRFPVVMMLSQTYLGNNSFFGFVRLNYYLRNTKYGYTENMKGILSISKSTKPVIERKIYNIWISGDDALISFK